MNSINHKRLYMDFLMDCDQLSEDIRLTLLNRIEQEESNNIPIRTLLSINKVINDNLPISSSIKQVRQLKIYDEDYINYVFDHQKEYGLSDHETAIHFNISRNTIAKWRKREYYSKFPL